MTFQELSKIAKKQLAKQPPLSLEQMREQAMRIKQEVKSKHKPKIKK